MIRALHNVCTEALTRDWYQKLPCHMLIAANSLHCLAKHYLSMGSW